MGRGRLRLAGVAGMGTLIVMLLAVDSFVLYRGYRVPAPKGGAFGVQPGTTPAASGAPGSGAATPSVSTSLGPSASPSGGQGVVPGPVPLPSGSVSPTGAARVPVAGDYIFSVASSSFESASGFGRRSFGPTAKVTVARLDDSCGGATGGWEFRVDIDYDPTQPNRSSKTHIERHWVVWRPAGLVERLEYGAVKFGAVTQTSEVCYRGPEGRVPFPLDAGTQSDGTSDAVAVASDPPFTQQGQVTRTEKWTGRVVAPEILTIAGQRVQTYRVDVVLCFDTTYDGAPCIPGYNRPESGYRIKQLWYAPSLGFYVKYRDRVHAKRYGFSYDEDVTATLKEFHAA